MGGLVPTHVRCLVQADVQGTYTGKIGAGRYRALGACSPCLARIPGKGGGGLYPLNSCA
jgi:hypothetical protein